MSQEAAESVVRRILGSWGPLAHAVRSGLGGTESTEKYEWLIYACAQYILSNRDLLSSEVEDYLSEYMDTHFNMVFEDDSLPMVSQDLVDCLDLLQRGESVKLQKRMDEFKPVDVVESMMLNMNVDSDSSSEDEDACDGANCEDKPMGYVGATNGVNASNRLGNGSAGSSQGLSTKQRVVDEDGFEMVTRRKGKR